MKKREDCTESTDARVMTAMDVSSDDVTSLLDAWSEGDSAALAELMDVVRRELRRMACRALRSERRDHTLQPTALVNELFLRLAGQRKISWRERAEFFGCCSNLMRRILVDHARRRQATKRGGDVIKISLSDGSRLSRSIDPEVVALDDALVDLARRSPLQSRIVEMRFIVGMSLIDIAAVERISPTAVSREWKAARLFLLSQLSET